MATMSQIEINTDVCVRSLGSITAALVRDHTGNRVNFTDVQVVKAASVLDGIRLAVDQHYNYVVLEGDCSQVYQGLLGDMQNIGWDVWTPNTFFNRLAYRHIGGLSYSSLG
ncbi:hypothetical protein PanWU01x14_340760 [Parasponia andersonii]|uniref:RNase H type-1 domain-containing protein n=1 Tax=Parasponia andersonii TaxID=3476 RepID=A0A2P5AEB8_PARAD|nr:hypothetical protein PanWU01x14_340760 [Parasponia andersonii]